MGAITTHILDTTLGRPARGVDVELEYQGATWEPVGTGKTNDDGRVQGLLADGALRAGTYRLRFHVGQYFWD